MVTGRLGTPGVNRRPRVYSGGCADALRPGEVLSTLTDLGVRCGVAPSTAHRAIVELR